jgi:Flp pilus assembly pilin Flp
VSIFPRIFKTFLAEENGATAIEYALIASILGVALLPVLSDTSTGVASLYTRVQDYFDIINGS